MNEIDQLASAMLAIAFAAVMLVAAQLIIEYRADKVVQPIQSMPLRGSEALRQHRRGQPSSDY
jgi:hypothetical protein